MSICSGVLLKNRGGYTQRGVAKGLKVPCLFIITEVSIRCPKKPRRLVYGVYPHIPTIHHCLYGTAGTDPLDMEATLTSPSGKIDTCEIRDLDDSLCQINFTPAEEGVHTISLKFKGIHFAGKMDET